MNIDFSNEKVNKLRLFGGSRGSKIGILCNGERYMLKFPAKPTRHAEASYTNSCICEYIACHIFESLGIETQKTLLGRYGDKITVACLDFESDGFLINEGTGEVRIAPVFDCASCLYPQLDEKNMQAVLSNREEIEDRLFAFPNSALKQDGVKINYARFLMTTGNTGCIKALNVIREKIDMDRINTIIDETPYISQDHKTFLKTMLRERKEHIIGTAQ